MFIGDVQIVRARTAIPKGAEVHIAYVPLDSPEPFRQGVLKPHFPNGCTCDACRASAPGRAKRAKRHTDLTGPSSDWAKARATLADANASEASQRHAFQVFGHTVDLLERSYPPQHGPVKLALFQALSEYAPACDKLAFTVFDRVFAAAGAEFRRTSTGVEVVALPVFYEHNVVQSMLLVAGRHAELGRRADARAWFKAGAKVSAMAQGFSYDRFLKEQEVVLNVDEMRKLVEACRP